jgi:phosphatidylinositol alpha-mannosyltransferase
VYSNGSQARITVGRTLHRDLKQVFRDGRYDIIHVHSPLTPVLPVMAIDAAEVPVIGTFHTYFDRSIGYRTLRRFFQRRLNMLSAAIAVSQSTIVALERYFDADWKIIPNGIDTDLFQPNVPRPAAIRTDVPAILFLGRFDPRNGLSTLIDAFKRVKGRGRRAQLVIVGDGPLRNHYYKAAGGDPDISFVGAVLEGRPAYYAHSAMYACPTTKASFGITLLESMACQTAIVCSDILGFRDVVMHGREALMVPREDRDALANGLVHLLDDEALRVRLGETGRKRALEYDWRRVTAGILDVYQDVLSPQPARVPVAV